MRKIDLFLRVHTLCVEFHWSNFHPVNTDCRGELSREYWMYLADG